MRSGAIEAPFSAISYPSVVPCGRLPCLWSGLNEGDPRYGVVATRLLPSDSMLPTFWKVDGQGWLVTQMKSFLRRDRARDEIVGILRETDRDPVAAVGKRHGVSDRAVYT